MNVLILLDVIKIPKEGCNIGYRSIVTSKEKLEEDASNLPGKFRGKLL